MRPILSGAVKQLRAANPNTVFAAAGDLIGASTFESFIQHDKPTLDALNEAGLDVSAAGNHEFDAGYDDLVNRVMQPESRPTPRAAPTGSTSRPTCARGPTTRTRSPTWRPRPAPPTARPGTRTSAASRSGFVGAVTEDLPSLVVARRHRGHQGHQHRQRGQRRAPTAARGPTGADVVVLLVHEGAPDDHLASADDTDDNAFGRIVNGVDTNVDAIVSGHTHLAYNSLASAGRTRSCLGRSVRPDAQPAAVHRRGHDRRGHRGHLRHHVPRGADRAVRGRTTRPTPPSRRSSTTRWRRPTSSDAVELGKLAGPFSRARLANGTTENRGGESTLGNLVAEVQRWATPDAGGRWRADRLHEPGRSARRTWSGNPGGYPVHADLQAGRGGPAVRQHAGQHEADGCADQGRSSSSSGSVTPAVPSRRRAVPAPGHVRRVLRRPTTRPAPRATGSRACGSTARRSRAATPYSVTVNSFLASGGDNFRAFTEGTGKRDTGKVDLQAMVDYMAAHASHAPLPVDTRAAPSASAGRPTPPRLLPHRPGRQVSTCPRSR